MLVTDISRVDGMPSSLLKVSLSNGNALRTKRVVLASGARESTPAERHGLVTGHRTSKMIFTNHLLDVGAPHHYVTADDSMVYVGSGLVARGHAMSSPDTYFIAMPRDEDRGLAQWYFGGPSPIPVPRGIRMHRSGYVDVFYSDQGGDQPPLRRRRFDLGHEGKVICAGELVPNDELWRGACRDAGIQLVGNAAPHVWGKIWPAMVCWAHARAMAAVWGVTN
jgi:hypothetical protein